MKAKRKAEWIEKCFQIVTENISTSKTSGIIGECLESTEGRYLHDIDEWERLNFRSVFSTYHYF